MITKPKDWDSAQAYTGESQQVTPGGHIVRLIGMRQEKSRNDKPMMVVGFDIEEGSELDGFYGRLLKIKRESNPQAKHQGVIRYMLYAKDGESTNSFFKGFIASVEASNPGYKWNWDERSLTGKMVGMVFGEEEYQAQDGTIKTSVKAQAARSVQAILDGVKVPEKKKLPGAPEPAPYDPNYGFTRMDDEKLPWE